MRSAHSLVVMLSLFLFSCHQTASISDFGIEPFKPVLLKGEGDPVCSRFASAWTDHYLSDKPISELEFDLAMVFPEAKHFRFPETRFGLYSARLARSLDVGNADSPKILYVEGETIGWRDMGPSLYLMDVDQFLALSPADQESARLSGRTFATELQLSNFRQPDTLRPPVLVDLRALDILHFMISEQTLYVMNVDKSGGWKDYAVASSLLVLDGDKAEELCRVHFEPSREALDRFLSQSAFFNALAPYYGYRGAGPDWSCLGTMGWTAGPIEYPFALAIFRPQNIPSSSVRSSSTTSAASQESRQEASELRYLSWGLSDPLSWDDYLNWRESRAEFISQMEEYYESFHTEDPEQARTMAEVAYRFVIDNIVYNHSQDRGLSRFTREYGLDSVEGSLSYEPQEWIEMAISRVREISPNELRLSGQPLAYELLRAGIYTQLPLATLQELVALLPPTSDNIYAQAEHQKQLSAVLLAAIGNEEYLQMALQLGPDLNVGTNEFQKTTLMYAAQLNEGNSVRVLLEHGAEVNAVTDSRFACPRLERDNRSALMYAAENASLELIQLLLDAGADSSAKDSKGNGVAWYLARNAKLSDGQRQRIGASL